MLYNKTTSLLRPRWFNRDLWIVTPIQYYISTLLILNRCFIKLTKAAIGGVIWRKLFLNVFQFSQENTCVGVSSLTLLKRGSNAAVLLLRNVKKHLLSRTSAYGCLWTYFRKCLFGTLFLDSRFQNHPDSVIVQKYRSPSN